MPDHLRVAYRHFMEGESEICDIYACHRQRLMKDSLLLHYGNVRLRQWNVLPARCHVSEILNCQYCCTQL
jgi:hypothetical protein